MSVRIYNAAEVKADLYNRITSDGELELLMGDTSINDVPYSWWQYDANSSAADNYAGGVIKPTLQTGNGRWLRRNTVPATASQSVTSRSLNTSFQPNANRSVLCGYSLSISVASLLLGTNSGIVFLEISENDSDWTTVQEVGLSVAGVASTTINSYYISGLVPANWYCRLRTTTSGTNGATITLLHGQETLL
jgi:hypothetical protein